MPPLGPTHLERCRRGLTFDDHRFVEELAQESEVRSDAEKKEPIDRIPKTAEGSVSIGTMCDQLGKHGVIVW